MLLAENIQGVLCLCPDRLDRKARAGLKTAKSRGVAAHTAEAHDNPDFDIMANTWPAARKLLRSWVGAGMSRILIVCWGGVGRSAAIAGAWLRSAENMSFAMTMETLMRARGTVLTNMSFRRALLTCFRDAQGCSSWRSLALDGRPGYDSSEAGDGDADAPMPRVDATEHVLGASRRCLDRSRGSAA